MKPEQKLYHLFKKNCPKISITRLEVYSAQGVPDLLLYNDYAGFSLLELKIQTGNRIKFSPHQILFHTIRTKRNYILVQTLGGPRSRLKSLSQLTARRVSLSTRKVSRFYILCQCVILPQAPRSRVTRFACRLYRIVDR
jgi:hypothetical protein